MSLSTSPVTIHTYLKDLLDDNKLALGLEKVYFGPLTTIPDFPSVVVEPRPTSRNLMGVRIYELILRANIIIAHEKIQTVGVTQAACDALAETVKAKIEEDKTLGGRVIFSHCSDIAPGYPVVKGVMLRANRLLWTGKSREYF